MKIRSIGLNGSHSTKKKKTNDSSDDFRALLQKSSLEPTHPTHETGINAQSDRGSPETWTLIEDAASLLDKAMEQIQASGRPEPRLVQSLQALRSKLHQCKDSINGAEDLDALITVETQRLQTW